MLKHCVLSVDYSQEWDKTLVHLPALITWLKIERLTLVHVVETHKRRHIEDSDAAVSNRLAKLAEKLQSERNVTVDHQLRHGFPASELAAVARKVEADGIIALNRSHSAARANVFGSVITNLTRVARVPLIVIPSDAKAIDQDSPIVLATDGSDSGRNAQRAFEDMMRTASRGVVVWVKADDDDEHDEERVQPILKHFETNHSKVEPRRIVGDDPAERIVSAAEEAAAGLIIIGKRGNTPLAELVTGSTAEAVARTSKVPVLLVP